MGSISYTIDVEKKLVDTVCKGNVTLPEFRKVMTELVSDPRLGTGMHSITDITGARMDGGFEVIAGMREAVRKAEQVRGPYKWALIVDEQNNLEHVNLFKMLAIDGQIEMRLFTGRDQAEAWIGIR